MMNNDLRPGELVEHDSSEEPDQEHRHLMETVRMRMGQFERASATVQKPETSQIPLEALNKILEVHLEHISRLEKKNEELKNEKEELKKKNEELMKENAELRQGKEKDNDTKQCLLLEGILDAIKALPTLIAAQLIDRAGDQVFAREVHETHEGQEVYRAPPEMVVKRRCASRGRGGRGRRGGRGGRGTARASMAARNFAPPVPYSNGSSSSVARTERARKRGLEVPEGSRRGVKRARGGRGGRRGRGGIVAQTENDLAQDHDSGNEDAPECERGGIGAEPENHLPQTEDSGNEHAFEAVQEDGDDLQELVLPNHNQE